jgi:hypothetical protein
MAYAPFDPGKSPRKLCPPEGAIALLIKINLIKTNKDEYETRS